MFKFDETKGDFWVEFGKYAREEQEQKQHATDSNTTPLAPVTPKPKTQTKNPKQEAKPQEKNVVI